VESKSEKETRRRALAVEGALILLVDRLATRGAISPDEGTEILSVLSKSSDFSASRVSSAMHTLEMLNRLRRGGCDSSLSSQITPDGSKT
jgi:dienelactone hydrolase